MEGSSHTILICHACTCHPSPSGSVVVYLVYAFLYLTVGIYRLPPHYPTHNFDFPGVRRLGQDRTVMGIFAAGQDGQGQDVPMCGYSYHHLPKTEQKMGGMMSISFMVALLPLPPVSFQYFYSTPFSPFYQFWDRHGWAGACEGTDRQGLTGGVKRTRQAGTWDRKDKTEGHGIATHQPAFYYLPTTPTPCLPTPNHIYTHHHLDACRAFAAFYLLPLIVIWLLSFPLGRRMHSAQSVTCQWRGVAGGRAGVASSPWGRRGRRGRMTPPLPAYSFTCPLKNFAHARHFTHTRTHTAFLHTWTWTGQFGRNFWKIAWAWQWAWQCQ